MRSLLLYLPLLLVFSCTSISKNQIIEDSPEIKVVTTYADQSRLLKEEDSLYFYEDTIVDENTISVDLNKIYQEVEGFGGALTQSTAFLIYNHPNKKEILNELFSADGLALNFIRLPLGASDFSLSWYSYDDVEGDIDLEYFSIKEDEKYTIPILKEILEIIPNIQIIGSPWSAPGWMKKGKVFGEKDLAGGFLNPDYYDVYADYLVKVIESYKKHGINFHSITLQNEPLHYSANYPCMYMDSDHQRELISIIGPKLDSANLNTKILLYDHNWDKYSYPRDVLDFMKNDDFRYVKGAAFHGYSGAPEGQSIFKNDYKDMKIYFTEITGGGWAPAFAMNLRWNYQKVFIGSMRNWSNAIMLWNLVLDEDGGPNIRAKANDRSEMMRGVITANSKSGKLVKEVEYYALGQMSKFIRPGAIRVGSSNAGGEVISASFKNLDGEIVLVVLNGSWKKDASFKVNVNGKSFEYGLPKESVVTFRWYE